MMKYVHVLLLITGICLSAGPVLGEEKHWTYSGHEGPEHWGELDPAFAVCSSGKSQSPVNLTGMIDGNLPEITINYIAGGNEILNNGHTIQVNYTSGSTVTFNGHSFELQQFHFHAPSENTIEGHSFPMEAHFVHADKDGNLAVIAVMFTEGARNAELEKAWNHMPEQARESHELTAHVDAKNLLPRDYNYYRLSGSLTTPPCSEGVSWLVMKSYNTASKEQLEKFVQKIHHPNNRPIQPINARMIVK